MLPVYQLLNADRPRNEGPKGRAVELFDDSISCSQTLTPQDSWDPFQDQTLRTAGPFINGSWLSAL
jgi:hypothetical protein